MRGFSWRLLDTKKELVSGQKFKVLVPKEIEDCFEDHFLGVSDAYRDYFVGIYEEYGSHAYLCPPDLYEILVMMNDDIDIKVDGWGCEKYTPSGTPVTIDIYNREMTKVKYPLRLTSIDDDKSYEDYGGLFSAQVPS